MISQLNRPLLETDDRDLHTTESLEHLQGQLRQSEAHFQDMFQEAPVGCHELDQEGIVLRVNRAQCILLGYEEREIVGRPVFDFISPQEREVCRERVLGRLTTGEDVLAPFEREFVRRDGTTLVVEMHSKLIRDTAGRGIGSRAFILDVTGRKRAEEALRKQAEDLARSNAELEQFAFVASHDLQEPLRKILAFGERLRNKHGASLGPEGQDYLARMQAAAARMQILIHDLLSLSRIASGEQVLAPVDLSEVARTVVSDLEGRIAQVRGRVEVGPLPIILADRGQIAQLFQNLIGNGLKFNKPDQAPVVKVHGELVAATERNPEECRVVVEDNGIGFDEKYTDKIFQVFQRLHGHGEYEGTGIGLAICRKIVDRHHGSIKASSFPGWGAKFTVTLPVRPPDGPATRKDMR